jgi:hypothetical protein
MLQWIGQPGQRVVTPSVELFPISESIFRNEFYRDQVTFIPDSDGRGAKLKVVYPEGDLELTRLSTHVPKHLLRSKLMQKTTTIAWDNTGGPAFSS